MTKELIIIALIVALIYLYYQNRKLKGLPATSGNSETIFELDEDYERSPGAFDKDQEDLIAEKDAALRSKNEAEAEVLSLNNRLKNKQQEVSRKEQEIERLKKEKSQSEIALNQKLSEGKKELGELQKKYSKQGQQLDTEQLENNKLTKEIEKLEEKITELTRSKSPMPGEFPSEDLVQEHQEQLRKINLLFDAQAKHYSEIDFNGLYSLLETIADEIKKTDRADIQPAEEKEIKKLRKENHQLEKDKQQLLTRLKESHN